MVPERPLWIELDLAALQHNFEVLRSGLEPDIQIIPALKGNAYGHGIEPIARALSRYEPHALAVGSLDDARAVRAVSTAPVLLFGGPAPDGYAALVDDGFIPTVHDLEGARAISTHRSARQPAGPNEVFVEVDSGLGRLGAPLESARSFIADVSMLGNLTVIGVYTHLTFHDAKGRDWARERLREFDALLDALRADHPEIKTTQALASTGLLTGLTSRANAVCPGSALYGICPVDPDLCDFSAYRPVLRSLKSRLIHINQPPQSVGVIPFGAADGMRRTPPGSDPTALINGQRVPIVGGSLEYTNLDLRDVDARVGDDVTLIGASGAESISLDDIGRWWNTDPLHALVSLSRSIPRFSL